MWAQAGASQPRGEDVVVMNVAMAAVVMAIVAIAIAVMAAAVSAAAVMAIVVIAIIVIAAVVVAPRDARSLQLSHPIHVAHLGARPAAMSPPRVAAPRATCHAYARLTQTYSDLLGLTCTPAPRATCPLATSSLRHAHQSAARAPVE